MSLFRSLLLEKLQMPHQWVVVVYQLCLGFCWFSYLFPDLSRYDTPDFCLVSALSSTISQPTCRVDYIPHPLSVQASCKKDSEYEPSTVAFDGLSTYNKEFTRKFSPVRRKWFSRSTLRKHKLENKLAFSGCKHTWNIEYDFRAWDHFYQTLTTVATDFIIIINRFWVFTTNRTGN